MSGVVGSLLVRPGGLVQGGLHPLQNDSAHHLAQYRQQHDSSPVVAG